MVFPFHALVGSYLFHGDVFKWAIVREEPRGFVIFADRSMYCPAGGAVSDVFNDFGGHQRSV